MRLRNPETKLKRHIGANIDPDIYGDFKVESSKQNRTMANLLKILIENHLSSQGKNWVKT